MRFEGILDRLFGEPKSRKKRRAKSREIQEIQRLSLPQILDIYATKDDIQNILYSLNLPVSGSKGDLIQRITKTTKSKPIQEVLNLIDRDTLRDICEDFAVPASGLKSELIERIIGEVLEASEIEGRPTIQKEAPKIAEKGLMAEPPADPLDEILDRMSREQVQSALRRMDLPVSGNKTQVVERLLEATKRDPRRTLEALPGDGLQYFADRKKIIRRRSKEDQIDELMSSIFDEEKKPIVQKEVMQKPQQESAIKEAVSKAAPINETFKRVVDDIENWSPDAAWPTEAGYQVDLYNCLKHKNYKTRVEKGESKIDILVDDQIPIELKMSPDTRELQRAYDQVFRHLDAFHSIIVVVCKPRNLDAIEDLRIRIAKYATPFGYPYKLIIKK
jgi:hypothetical protein